MHPGADYAGAPPPRDPELADLLLQLFAEARLLIYDRGGGACHLAWVDRAGRRRRGCAAGVAATLRQALGLPDASAAATPGARSAGRGQVRPGGARTAGVRRHRNKWQARVWDGAAGRHVNLGLHDTEAQAEAAVREARERVARGEPARPPAGPG